MMANDNQHEPIEIASERAREADEGLRSDGLLAMLLIGVGFAVVGIFLVMMIKL